jgi:hypothetical protein
MLTDPAYDYPRQRFRLAVARLATGHGSIQERVSAAFHALDTAISHGRVPGDIGIQLNSFAALWSEGPDSSIDRWALNLTVDEAVEIATWLLQASYAVEELWLAPEGTVDALQPATPLLPLGGPVTG